MIYDISNRIDNYYGLSSSFKHSNVKVLMYKDEKQIIEYNLMLDEKAGVIIPRSLFNSKGLYEVQVVSNDDTEMFELNVLELDIDYCFSNNEDIYLDFEKSDKIINF